MLYLEGMQGSPHEHGIIIIILQKQKRSLSSSLLPDHHLKKRDPGKVEKQKKRSNSSSAQQKKMHTTAQLHKDTFSVPVKDRQTVGSFRIRRIQLVQNPPHHHLGTNYQQMLRHRNRTQILDQRVRHSRSVRES